MTDTISGLRQRARDFVDPTARLGVAVSGGGDSLAILHLLVETGRNVKAVTVDHGLRPESAEEAGLVGSECTKLGVHHTVLRWGGPCETGNLQDQARSARYRLMADWARVSELQAVVLGHTCNDDAETFLMRLARGSGIDGLTPMAKRFERSNMVFLRPFTVFRRETLRQYLREKRATWIEDPSNDDDRFDRIKARRIFRELEPLGINVENIAMTMSNLGVAQTALQWIARSVAESEFRLDRGDLIFDRDKVEMQSLETLRRLLIGAVMFVAGNEYPPRRETVHELWEALLDRRRFTIGGCLVSHEGDKTRISREFNAVKDITSPTDALWDGRWRLAGPHDPDLEIRALGEAVKDTPWRETGMPRESLMASPAIWRGDDLIAAPVAGLSNGWTAEATGRGKFTEFLISR